MIFFLASLDRAQRPESAVGIELPQRLPGVADPPEKVQQERYNLQRKDAGDGTGKQSVSRDMVVISLMGPINLYVLLALDFMASGGETQVFGSRHYFLAGLTATMHYSGNRYQPFTY